MIATEAEVRRALEEGRMTLEDAGQVQTFAKFLQRTSGLPTAAKDRTPAQQARFLRAYFACYSEEPTVTERLARVIVRERSSGRCEIGISSVCHGRAVNVSHRIRRGQGGLWQPSNLLDACGSGTTGCHGWVGSRPVLAEAAGLAIPSHALTAWPVWCEPYGWHRGWWHPRDDGSWTECAELGGSGSPWESVEYRPAGHAWAKAHALECERPDSNREQRRAHASLCTGIGACAA